MKKLLPNQIRAVLQGLELRLSYREIGRRNNISRTTVGLINNVYLNSGQNLTQLQKLNDNQILELVYPVGPNKQSEPDWQDIHSRLARHAL